MNQIILSLREDYWSALEIKDADIDFLYNYLIELEKPATLDELVDVLVKSRIDLVKESFERQRQQDGKLYLPEEEYKVGDGLVFPAFNWQKATVNAVREGMNPEVPSFEVITVEFEDGSQTSFAAKLAEHTLNEPLDLDAENPLVDYDYVIANWGNELGERLRVNLAQNPDLVCIAEKWFPKALLVDVNIGYLNLAEALLDMEGGGPLTTASINQQIDLPTDVNKELTEFSLNVAMHSDDRFDEVGPSGEVLWFLKRLEPEWVQNPPVYLQYKPIEYSLEDISEFVDMFSAQMIDEHSDHETRTTAPDDSSTVSLLYPHWRSGTLPLSQSIYHFFPTALQSQRVRFTFVDGYNGSKFSGWVVRPSKYIGGLFDWYREQGVMPGTQVHLSKGDAAGEVVIKVGKKRSSRDWIRTLLVGSDGSIVFAMLKQLIKTDIDERMAIYVPETTVLDEMWKSPRHGRFELGKTVMHMMQELIKLNPQNHVHFEEIYAAVNLRFRCPPGPIMSLLLEKPWAIHMGDLYFQYNREHLEG